MKPIVTRWPEAGCAGLNVVPRKRRVPAAAPDKTSASAISPAWRKTAEVERDGSVGAGVLEVFPRRCLRDWFLGLSGFGGVWRV